MIEAIEVKGIASYGSETEILSGLKKINYIYGANGVGKTTISRLINDSSQFHSCRVKWEGDNVKKTMVYNRDFVEDNFSEDSELKGIFTIGGDVDVVEQIKAIKVKLTRIETEGLQLKSTLSGEGEGAGGKQKELLNLEDSFAKECWKLKQTHDSIFSEAFSGYRNNKENFKSKFLSEQQSNKSDLKDFEYLKKQSETIFGEVPKEEISVKGFNFSELLKLEKSSLLEKRMLIYLQ